MSQENRQADYTWVSVVEFANGTKLDLGPALTKKGGGVERESVAHRPASTRQLKRLPGLPVPQTIELEYSHTGQDIEQLRKAVLATVTGQELDQNRNLVRKPDSFICTVDGVTEPETNVDSPEVAKFTITFAPNEK